MRRESRERVLAGVALAAVLLPGWAGAQTAGTGLTAHDVARIRTVGEVALSPDGGSVAYTQRVPRDPFEEPDGAAWSRLRLLDVASGTDREFVGGQVRVGSVGWHPDGVTITYLARREGDSGTSLYRIRRDGGESDRLLSHQTSIEDYALSPDGTRVAFLAADPEPEPRTELRSRGFRQRVFEEDEPYTRVWVAGLGAGATPRSLPLEGHASLVAWSPGGDRLLVALAPTPHVDDRYMSRRLSLVDAESGAVLARIDNPGKLGAVSWSPDGRHVAFVSGATKHDPKEGRLMVAKTSDGGFADLLPGLEGHVTGVAWADENTVLYLVDEGVRTRLGEVRVDGSGRRTRFGPDGPVITSFSAPRRARAIALVGESAKHPAELFLLRGDRGTAVRATDSNPWLAARALGPQERVEWTARDGLRLEGMLIRPTSTAGPSPTIVVVHGGPEAHERDGWLTGYSDPGQVAAAKGFAVFYPNYRGSTGRGVEFSMLDHGDFAGAEFDDIVDGVDHLIATGVTDGARVGVTGGSYGGYATAWLTTRHSRRFAAGVMFVGISDLISKDGTSDIPEEMFLVHQRTRSWENWQLFLERSPIFWADSSRTPLLIAHGTADTRVPTLQSFEMYRHLKQRGSAPVRLVLYPDEGHGNARAAARLDYSLRVLRWFEHYLMGPGGDAPPLELDPREAQPPRATAGASDRP